MSLPARRLMASFALGLTVFAAAAAGVGAGGAARAQGLFDQPKYAAIVVDAKTGEVLYTRRADAQRFPASITKVMTLYLVFEALATGRLSLTDRITVSAHAASQRPSKLGLKPGESISVDDAIRSAAVLSANDMAVALAERVGGGEERFARLMTLRAHELGMNSSTFYNANGLPMGGGGNVSTARDIAILSRAVMRDYPQYYSYFSQKQFAYRGRLITNHNRLLLKMPGVDGIKTGYTGAAGFNLAASAVRDGRRLITVVLGGSSTAARDENVQTLLTAGFDVLNRRERGQRITVAQLTSEPDDVGGPVTRPAVEMGSVDQKGLEVELAEAAAQAAPRMAIATVASRPVPNPVEQVAPPKPTALAKAVAPPAKAQAVAKLEDCAASEGRHAGRRHRRHAAPSCEIQTAKADVIDCAKLRRAKRHACERDEAKVQVAQASTKAGGKAKAEVAEADGGPDCLKLRGSRRHRCEREEKTAVQLADAAPAKDKPDCAKLKRSKRKACEAGGVETADAGAKTATGKYLIQVGAYGNRHQAEEHLAKVSGKFGGVVSTASGQVTTASGNFRVRFSGYSQAAAKSACQKLSAKGERCMVMASS